MDAIGEAMANPLSYLWLMFTQNDVTWNNGDILDDLDLDPEPQNTFMINPVLSVQLTEEWKAIVRPVIPINSFNTLDNLNFSTGTTGTTVGADRERKTGLLESDLTPWSRWARFLFWALPLLEEREVSLTRRVRLSELLR